MEKLNVVEATIRKALPRLMEPTEGCYLKNYGSAKMYRVIGREGEVCFLQDINDLKLSPLEITESTAINYFEIIGHDILINDVLEWLGHERKNELYTYSLVDLSDNILKVHLVTQISDVEHYAHEEIWESIEIDLTKHRLIDQPEKLINDLYNLINSEE